ncbi:hypothetical protein BT96DRAFT_960554 [Gymnopus androsaceus JB14]|uniref:Uncharacterized protein n=1 Tax=Gymnopus androsaceus JB14 TaxID=1447944 RepID=A0A6A4GLF2_9AGAR|nr:hypothetical protein BT96DRAFT_960554 [Gymnopus androsaceus JB14]
MIADWVSEDHGWLHSPDGTKSTRLEFKAGKACNGYMTNNKIIAQAKVAIDILLKFYPDKEHVLVYNNTKTHTKCTDDALSAMGMPEGLSKPGGPNFGSSRVKKENGLNVTAREWIHMRDGKMPDGTNQSLYFPDDHPTHPGYFKGMAQILRECRFHKEAELPGMAQILRECGFHKEAELPVQCSKFQCPPGVTQCYTCAAHGVTVLFLPKFHCELNFIEQLWGAAKRKQCLPQGVNGALTAWAAKVYRSHHMLPNTILAQFDQEIAAKQASLTA